MFQAASLEASSFAAPAARGIWSPNLRHLKYEQAAYLNLGFSAVSHRINHYYDERLDITSDIWRAP